MKKVAIITTVNHNVGDDFVREGIIHLLKSSLEGIDLRFQLIHKHSPITSRYGWEWFRWNRAAQWVDKFLPLSFGRDRILEADLLVQSGAPLYWCHSYNNNHCFNTEWYKPLIRRRYMQYKKDIPLLNLAVGTCQAYHSDGHEIAECSVDGPYIKEFFTHSLVTTFRDSLSQNVLNLLGCKAPVLPCSSIFAVDGLGLEARKGEYVVLNYMHGGAHYTINQPIDFVKWRKSFLEMYEELKAKESNILFVCHNASELKEAKKIDPSAEMYISDDYIDYIHVYARARYGIMNRVHGAFMMASMGKESIIIGNDTRARIASEIGMKHYFVNDVDTDLLIKERERLEVSIPSFEIHMKNVKEKAFQGYMEALAPLKAALMK